VGAAVGALVGLAAAAGGAVAAVVGATVGFGGAAGADVGTPVGGGGGAGAADEHALAPSAMTPTRIRTQQFLMG